MSKQIVKYAEIACEYKTMELLSIDLSSKGANMKTPSSTFASLYANYVSNVATDATGKKTLQSEINKRLVLCTAAAKSMSNSLLEKYSDDVMFDIIPFNKEGLKEGVSQKSDINIEIYENSSLIDTREISLKIYVGKNKPGAMNMQVASGTFLSTLCGLGFDVIGRGSFRGPQGDKFGSKKSGVRTILENFEQRYGEQTTQHLNEVLRLTNKAHELRVCPTKPSDIDSIRKSIGTEAIHPFVNLLTEMDAQGLLRQRLLERLGLNGSGGKEVVAACFTNNSKTQVFNSIGNDNFHRNIGLLNDSDSTLSFEKVGQGVGFSFKSADGLEILSTKMPLTININGAWANKDRWDKLDKCHYKKGERRLTKSKQLDTSTNFYLNIGQVF